VSQTDLGRWVSGNSADAPPAPAPALAELARLSSAVAELAVGPEEGLAAVGGVASVRGSWMRTIY